jgi:hypothetical protein
MGKKTILLVLITFLLGVSAVFLWLQIKNKLNDVIVEPIIVPHAQTSPIQTSITPSVTLNPVLPSPTSVPTLTSSLNNFSTWTTYTNNTLKYRFLYDPVWNLTTQANTTSVQGDVSSKGWPSINVSKLVITATDILDLKTQVENMFNESTTETTIGLNISAVLLERVASPQAYAGKDYYLLHQGNTFVISLNDTGHLEADQIYQYFLNNFEIY